MLGTWMWAPIKINTTNQSTKPSINKSISPASRLVRNHDTSNLEKHKDLKTILNVRSIGPLYMVLRKKSDHGMLTMYFADHKLLTFKYLNQGPILHLSSATTQ